MAVQDAQAPGGEDEEPHAREQDAHDADGELADLALESGSHEPDDRGRGQDADGDDHADGEREQGGHDSGHAARQRFVLLREQPRIDGDEGRGEDTFAEEVLEEVRDAKGGLEGAGGVGVAEIVGEDALAHEAGDAAEEDPRGHEDGKTRPPRGLPQWLG